jgi:hypothetical protein
MGRLFLGAGFWALAAVGWAQDARQALVTVSVSADTVTVGEPFTVKVRVRAPKVATIRFPEVPAAGEGIDPVDPRAIEEGPTGEFLDRTALYTFVAWDVGRRGPALDPVGITIAGREERHAFPAPTVVVRSLLPPDAEREVPKEARPPVRIPGRLWQYLVAGGAVLGAFIYWLRLRGQRRRQARGRAAPEPWAQAKGAFAALDQLQLAESGEAGRHVIAHVDVLRTYLARRFPEVDVTLDGPAASVALTQLDFPLPVHRVAALLDRDAELRFAHAGVGAEEALALATEAKEIAAQLQLAHEARLRAIERPPRPRRR